MAMQYNRLGGLVHRGFLSRESGEWIGPKHPGCGAFAASLNWKLSVQANGVNLLEIYGMTAKEAKSWHRTTSISVYALLPMN